MHSLISKFLAALSVGIFLFFLSSLVVKEFFLMPRDSEALGQQSAWARLYREGSAPGVSCEKEWCLEGQEWGLPKNKKVSFLNLRSRVMDMAEFLEYEERKAIFSKDAPLWAQAFVRENGQASVKAWMAFLKGEKPLSLNIFRRAFGERARGAWYGEQALSWPRKSFYPQEPEAKFLYEREWKGALSPRKILAQVPSTFDSETWTLAYISQVDKNSPFYAEFLSSCPVAQEGAWYFRRDSGCEIMSPEGEGKPDSLWELWRSREAFSPLETFMYGSQILHHEQGLSFKRLRAILVYDDGLVQRFLHYELQNAP